MKVRKTLIGFAGLVGLFVAGVLLFNFVIMPTLIHQRSAVIVPELTGFSEARAERELARFGLNLRVDRSEHHPDVPEGFVIQQAPRASETIKEGRTVQVVLSLGARTERIPELSGMSLRQARGLLERQNLRVGRVVRVTAHGEAREEVIASHPRVGEDVTEGAAVDLVIAVGGSKREFAMPDLTGQDLLFIRDKLRDMGFRVSGVRYERREGVFPNTVIDQSPRPGAMIREGDSIELVAAGAD
ncbi:MAG: PASTA domain-containing protein [Candidatus Krumholzibacteria bacterium]|nr:PASTA domain-containing protein [Candidatus Krumholzibacteria bacterium]